MIYKITFYCHPSSRFLFSEWFWKYFTSKSSSSDVFAIKNRLERRPTTPLVSGHAHGPKQLPSNLFWCTYYMKNFLSTHERSSLLSKFWFLSKFCQNFASEELLVPWKPKKVDFSWIFEIQSDTFKKFHGSEF